jgi:prephenate dehydrogenase
MGTGIRYDKLAILGVGLMGASLALAMRKHSLCGSVSGYGRTEGNLAKAKDRGIVDSYHLDPAEACSDADLVVFCTPVGRFESLAAEIRGSLKKGATVIDVGSIKGGLVRRMEALMPEGVRFVGCHPIAGSERSGIEVSDGDLFKGATCVITNTDRTDLEALGGIREMWETLGSKVKMMGPEEHDRVYALVSHIPHLVAYALVNTVGDVDGSYLGYAGQGFKDTTRIASSSPDLWRDICMHNRDNMLDFIGRFRDNLDKLGNCLKSGDSEGLEEAFNRARALRALLDD